MSFVDAIKSGFAKYADFSGRARRSEFWFWALFVLLLELAAVLVDALLGTTPLFYVITVLPMLLPSLAVTIRRLHDRDHSGWWVLIGVIPFGGIVLLVFYCQDSTPDNRFGPSPKAATAWSPTPV